MEFLYSWLNIPTLIGEHFLKDQYILLIKVSQTLMRERTFNHHPQILLMCVAIVWDQEV